MKKGGYDRIGYSAFFAAVGLGRSINGEEARGRALCTFTDAAEVWNKNAITRDLSMHSSRQAKPSAHLV